MNLWKLTDPAGRELTGPDPWSLVSRAVLRQKPVQVLERTAGPAASSIQEVRNLRTQRAAFCDHDD